MKEARNLHPQMKNLQMERMEDIQNMIPRTQDIAIHVIIKNSIEVIEIQIDINVSDLIQDHHLKINQV
jgi:hypothetical protein